HFRLSLEADPGSTDAAARLLGHLADAQEWAEYDEVARLMVRRAPDDARSHLFRGLGLHERGRDAEAEVAFRRALELLPAPERRVFEDVEPLLPSRLKGEYATRDSAGRAETARLIFTGKDPLFLTEANERRLEHFARLAWAELKFSAPASGLRGWSSDRGRIWVRYGKPGRSYQCCYAAAGQRNVYWSYGRHGPLFTFTRNLTYRRASFTDAAGQLSEELEATAPELYRPRTVTTLHPLPHQLARFRGSEPRLTRVELYAAPPLDSLFAAPGSRVETGVFTFLEDYTPLWEQRAVLDVSDRGVALTYRFEVPAGRFRYGIEARLAGPDSLPRPAARAREVLRAEDFGAGRLAISDLLLTAVPVIARTEGPTRRDQLVLSPLRGTTLAAGEPIHLYFEVYGLEAGEAGVAGYRAELAVEDSTQRNVAERLLRAGRELVGTGTPETRVSWERQMRVEDDLVPEFLSVEVPRLPAGDYVVRVRITDVATGRSAERVRHLSVEGEP
ncbi:MAG TPA: GWxTD domain-containing protein, partial [Longimicrobiales bacterium]|nr:GWxTD domain-containing protein [Longimicrobiales bacterium]